MIPSAREHIEVTLVLDGRGRPCRANIASTRTVTASRVLEGRRPEDALQLLPLLFALCGTSHQVAGLSAFEAATGTPVPAVDRLTRQVLVTAETLAEHTTRMLVDWPGLVSRPPSMAEARAVRDGAAAVQVALYPGPSARARAGGGARVEPAALRQALAALDWALGAALPVAAETLEALLAHPFADTPAPLATAMPARLDPAILAARLAAPDAARFQREPDWEGAVLETGPAARHHADPAVAHESGRLAARLRARLVDTAAARERMAEMSRHLLAGVHASGSGSGSGDVPIVSAHAIRDGAGLAMVETSRGRLVHYLEVTDDRIGRYRVLAPTEWTFHPRGALTRALEALPAEDAATVRRRAQWLVAALDPCVACAVSVTAEGEGAAHA